MTTTTTTPSPTWRDHDDRDAHQDRLGREMAAELGRADGDW